MVVLGDFAVGLTRIVERLLWEVSHFPVSWKGRNFFAGVAAEKDAQACLAAGALPVGKKKTRVGFSVSLPHALRYALGGDYAGRKMPDALIRQYGRYGYLFVVDAGGLSDVTADGGSVARLVQILYDRRFRDGEAWSRPEKKFMEWCWPKLSEKEREAVVSGSQPAHLKVGTRLSSGFPDEIVLWLMDQRVYDVHLENEGPVRFRDAYRLDRTRTVELAEDGSNVFERGERVR